MASRPIAQEPGAGHIRVSVEQIHYEGKNEYSVVLGMENLSSTDVFVRISEEVFALQQEQGWLRLQIIDDGKNREHEPILLPRDVKHERVAVFNIPRNRKGLFSTYEGDLSLMYQYRYDVRTRDETIAFEKADQVYCWLTPGTSKWILREGM